MCLYVSVCGGGVPDCIDSRWWRKTGNLGLDLWKYVIYCDVSVCFVIYLSKIKFAEVSLAFLGGL